MLSEPPDLLRIARALDRDDLQYVLVGGLAIVVWGGTRITQDCDLAIAFDILNRRRIVEALAPLNPRPMRLAPGAAWEWDDRCIRAPWTILATDAGRVDLMIRLPGVDSFAGLYARSELKEAAGVRLRVAAIDDLLAMKAEAERDKDREDTRQLLAIKALQGESGTLGA